MVRIRWKDPVPPRDWKRWGFAYAAHFTTGVISGLGPVLGALLGQPTLTASIILTAAVCARQGLEWGRRNDTPGRDIGDHIIGLALTLAVGFVAVYSKWLAGW